MRIQHNIMAMNAYRNYNTNTSALSKNLEKLSSGYKINRAGDDAAGLAISEKMRAQITGLNAAQKNVKDGISLVKTAEGAMQEIQDMLNRMDYLATQSANGTYDDEVDRKNLQKEVDALKQEIDRIADSANFNGIKLLDGSLETGAAGKVNDQFLIKAGTTHFQTHEAGGSAVKAQFKIDLNQVLAGAKATASASAFTFNLTVGGATIAIKATVATAVKTDAFIDVSKVTFSATAATAANQSLTSGTAGGEFKVTINGGILSFTWASKTTGSTAQAEQDFMSSLQVNFASASKFEFASGVTDNCFTQTITDGKALKPDRLAHAHFTLGSEVVKALASGATLTIGTQAITLSTGTKTTSAGVIGVKDLLDADGNVKTDAATIKEIGDRLTRAASNNAMFTVGYDDSKKTVTLQEKRTYYTSASKTLLDKDNLVKAVKLSTTGKAGKALVLQIGDTAENYNRLDVSVGDMHCKALGIGSKGSGIDISTPDGAKNAIDTIKKAINTVSGVRGDLGAVQNRLEHTANNLSVMAENIQDAESTIRDTDVAEEMMAYTKNNILIQSAQAMLAQANAVPQGVLQLLG